MDIKVSKKIIDTYKNTDKNPNNCLAFILESIDPDAASSTMSLIEECTFLGEKVSFNVDDSNIKYIKALFGKKDIELTAERLLWVALLWPEI